MPFAVATLVGLFAGGVSAKNPHRPPPPADAAPPPPEPQPDAAPSPSDCVPYGRICHQSADCCSPLFCHFDGYNSTCRY
jgi:hypothetical protein